MTIELPVPDPLLHPVGNNHTGHAGVRQLRLLRHLGLHERSALLEVGCGLGRLVRGMAEAGFLVSEYRGFDIARRPVAWLNEHYKPALPNYRFAWVDVANARYRPSGRGDATQTPFPFRGPFDMVCAFSVFTHLPTGEVAAYLHEVRRVLGSGGRAVLTFYAVGDEKPRISGNPLHRVNGFWTTDPKLPERAIAYDEATIERLVVEAGLAIDLVVDGTWRGGTHKPRVDQDTYVLSPS